MKKTFVVAICFVLATVLAVPAKADTWQTKWMVNKSTTATLNPEKAVQDTNGNKWFHAYEANSPNAFAGSFIYEYSAGESWTNHTDTIQALLRQSLNGNATLTVGDEMSVISMFTDKTGNFWASVSPCSLVKYDGSSWSYTSPETVWGQVLGQTVNDINGGYFYDMFGDNQGNLYSVAGISGAGMGNEESIRVIKKSAATGTWSTAIPKDSSVITYAHQARLKGAYNDSTGDFWFYLNDWDGTANNGVYRYHNSSWANYTTADGLAANNINTLKIDSSGNVWVGTDSGVSKFDGSAWTTWNTANSSLSSNYINQIAQDNSGRIWFTSIHDNDHANQGGAAIYDSATNTWSYYSSKNGNDDFDDITKIFFLGNDLWAMAGFQQNGFIVLNQNDLQSTLYGQIGGTQVTKTSLFSPAKKKKGAKIQVWKMKHKTHKWVRGNKVYNRRSSGGWYKALNLSVGKYYVKVQGKKARTIDINSGDPTRLNFF